jgi:dTDP-glucose 4,6-dehydratase
LKLFVTGGAGFIGSNFIRHVLFQSGGHSIVNYDKLTYAGNLANLEDIASNPKYKFINGDICDAKLVNEVMRGCDAVVHFAAESHVDRSIAEPAPVIQTNVTGTFTLLEAARENKVGKFVHISTDEVYGDVPAGITTDERYPVQPSSPYSASKAAADLLVLSFVRTYGLPAVITRSCNNYGPFQFPEKFLPLMISRALDGKPVPVYGDGGQEREWLHVEDNCRAVFAVLERGRTGEVYNIGTGTTVRNLEVAHQLLQILGKPESLISHVIDRPGHDRRYAVNCAKIQRELRWQSSTSLQEGLRSTIDWYRNNSAWLKSILSKENAVASYAWGSTPISARSN